MSWHAAGERCNLFGGHLISLQNRNELDALASRLRSGLSYWTDINDINKEGEFLSHTTNSKAPFLHFSKTEPNNFFNEDCVLLKPDMEMNDFPCNVLENFICELKAE
ncbi:GH22505 [Drosophila grimshawi]|uniref:GH22505 n=1 Tax=Drosophila grimshawi TaxID=7222 RepID=B4K3B8_DROGR|nr:GH22505 [Drosophila grimshawi]